jgi:hypothetical protein
MSAIGRFRAGGEIQLGRRAGVVAVGVVALLLVIGGPLASVHLRTGSFPGTDPVTPGGLPVLGCYTSGIGGQLVPDPAAGVAIIDRMNGHRAIVTWPRGYTARRAWSGVEVLNRAGRVVARTGTHIELSGGFGPDGTFLECGGILPSS